MGVAIHFSLRKFDKLNTTVSLKIIRRTVALFAVGIALDCFSKLCYGTFSWEHLRILGVMQRLALAYAGGAFLAILIPKKLLLSDYSSWQRLFFRVHPVPVQRLSVR